MFTRHLVTGKHAEIGAKTCHSRASKLGGGLTRPLPIFHCGRVVGPPSLRCVTRRVDRNRTGGHTLAPSGGSGSGRAFVQFLICDLHATILVHGSGSASVDPCGLLDECGNRRLATQSDSKSRSHEPGPNRLLCAGGMNSGAANPRGSELGGLQESL